MSSEFWSTLKSDEHEIRHVVKFLLQCCCCCFLFFFLCELVERDECGRGDGFVCSVYYDHVGCACIHVIFYRCSKGPSACLASFLFCLALKTMCFTEYDKQNHSLGMMMIIIILLWLTLLLCTYFVITNSFCITRRSHTAENSHIWHVSTSINKVALLHRNDTSEAV